MVPAAPNNDFLIIKYSSKIIINVSVISRYEILLVLVVEYFTCLDKC